MSGMTRRTFLSTAAVLGVPGASRAQPAFPAKPIRLVIPFPAAGAADFLGRVIGERMAGVLGQSVLVENRPGAGGNIGTMAVAQGEHDGYTVLLSGVNIAVNRFLFRSLPFNAERDFEPVAMIATVPNLMIVPASLPVNTVAEFVAYAKQRPGKINYASIGSGTSLHLAGAQFNSAAGIDMEHVPYKETSAANADLMAGRVDVMFQTISAAVGMARGGRVKALAVTSDRRVGAFPDVPTLQQAGVDLVTVGWFGLFVPTGVPPTYRAILEREALAAVRDPVVAARISESGSIPRGLDGNAFAAFIKEEVPRLQEVVRKAGIEPA